MDMAASFKSRDIFLYGIVQDTMRKTTKNEVESHLKAYKGANPNLGLLYLSLSPGRDSTNIFANGCN